MGLVLSEIAFYWDLMQNAIDAEKSNGLKWKEGFTAVRSWKDYMIVYDTPEKYYIICSGTSGNIQEWFSNLLAWPSMSGFHFGFWNTARRFKRKLKKKEWFDKPVDVICYSRGVYGVLLSYQMKLLGLWNNIRCVSFGSPEAFKDRGIEKMENSGIEHYRIFTDEDIVPKFGASKHWSTEDIKLPSVKGFDHISYQRIIENAIKLKED